MPDPERGQCRGCGAPIFFARTAATGCLIPLDAEPVPDGNVMLKDGLAHVLKGDLFGGHEDTEGGRPRYKSHYATCPQASRFRRWK